MEDKHTSDKNRNELMINEVVMLVHVNRSQIIDEVAATCISYDTFHRILS
jgi:hypothetical protein